VAKKQKNKTSRYKRMKRHARLQAAKTWVIDYPGKNLVTGYSKYFAVDKLCAVKELEMIGVKVDLKYVEQLRAQHEHNLKKKKEKRERKQRELVSEIKPVDQDHNFFYIAGYTSNGFPYGVTWEEYERESEKQFFEEDYYYIAGYTEDGEIFGITWDEYLNSLNEEELGEPMGQDINNPKNL
jgi:hypothetical protein